MGEARNHPSTWKSMDETDDQVTTQTALCLTVLSHPNLKRIGERAFLWSTIKGDAEPLSRICPDFAQPDEAFGQPLNDPFISRSPILFQAASNGSLQLKLPVNCKLEVNGERAEGTPVLTPSAIEDGVTLVIENRVCLLLHTAHVRPNKSAQMGLVGDSHGMEKVLQAIEAVADLDVPVLIRGETGTGKELVAQALHRAGSRRSRPFVSVNLAALPQSLAISELFGADKGAYTGSSENRMGYFRTADRGVLFLDEIGEASSEIQALLLRSLETSQVTPVGRQVPVTVDVRLVAATDADLEDLIENRSFKAPLLHRLAGYEIFIPPLRQRREDIGRLFRHFVFQELQKPGMKAQLTGKDPRAPAWLPAALCASLALYSWPGNVRQFRNTVRQLLIDNRHKPTLQANKRLTEMLSRKAQAAPSSPLPFRKPHSVTDAELRSALKENQWKIKGTARTLGIVRSSLYDLLKRFNIPTVSELDNQTITDCYNRFNGDLDAMVVFLEVSKNALRNRIKSLSLPLK